MVRVYPEGRKFTRGKLPRGATVNMQQIMGADIPILQAFKFAFLPHGSKLQVQESVYDDTDGGDDSVSRVRKLQR